jgi:hypothetical protein
VFPLFAGSERLLPPAEFVYTVEGKLAEGAIAGTWIDGDMKGDFKITKS